MPSDAVRGEASIAVAMMMMMMMMTMMMPAHT
jgi:hypothetical protein